MSGKSRWGWILFPAGNPRAAPVSRRWIGALLALFAVVTGLGLATAFVGLIAVGGVVAWFLLAPAGGLAGPEAAPILVDLAWEDGGYQEPIRKESRRRGPAAVASASSGANLTGSSAAEAPVAEAELLAVWVSGEAAPQAAPPAAPPPVHTPAAAPAVAATPPPDLEEAVRALQARMASGKLALREGEGGRVSLTD